MTLRRKKKGTITSPGSRSSSLHSGASSPSAGGYISSSQEAVPVSAHFHEEEAGSRAQADGFRALAVDSPVEAADFRAQGDVILEPAAGFHAPVADSLERAADFLAPGAARAEVRRDRDVHDLERSRQLRGRSPAARL